MSTPSGHGYIYEAAGAFHVRFNTRVKGKRVQRSIRLCTKDAEHPDRHSPSVIALATEAVEKGLTLAADREKIFQTGRCPTCGRLTRKQEVQNQ